jgi:antitoxin VapB
MADTAKLFKNGRSQAVRLPKEYRFEGDEVKIYKSGNRVILEPIEKEEWPEGFWRQFRKETLRSGYFSHYVCGDIIRH